MSDFSPSSSCQSTRRVTVLCKRKVSYFLLSIVQISDCRVSSSVSYKKIQLCPDFKFSYNYSVRALAVDTKCLTSDLCMPRAGFKPGWSGVETRV